MMFWYLKLWNLNSWNYRKAYSAKRYRRHRNITASKSTMTAGGNTGLHKDFWNFAAWGLKPKKRQRSGSGGSTKDMDNKKKSIIQLRKQRDNSLSGGDSSRGGLSPSSSSQLEVVAPVTADVEFKYTWPIDGFVNQVKNGNSSSLSSNVSGGLSNNNNGLDSQPFEVNVNGVRTRWNLSVRFWTGEDGERLANPFVLCLNLLGCSVAVDGCSDGAGGSSTESQQPSTTTTGVKFTFGILNRVSDDYEMFQPDNRPSKSGSTVLPTNTSEIKSLGYKNLAIGEKHVNGGGDIRLVCKLKIVKDDSSNHSLSSDLKALINDEKSADVVVEAGGKEFKVHRNILSARSPVFASLLEEQEQQSLVQESHDSHILKHPDSDSPKSYHKESRVLPKTSAEVSSSSEEDVMVHVAENRSRSNPNNSDHEVGCHVKTNQIQPQQYQSHHHTSRTNGHKISTVSCGSNSSCGSSVSTASSSGSHVKKPKLKIDNLRAETLEEVLSYIYTDSSASVDSGNSESLLKAADAYALPGLKAHCEHYLSEAITPVNVAAVLMLADTHSCQGLKSNALKYCKDNHNYIVKDTNWKTIEEEKPNLFQEAVTKVVGEGDEVGCDHHTECIKKKGKRFEIERASSLVRSGDTF